MLVESAMWVWMCELRLFSLARRGELRGDGRFVVDGLW